MKAYVLKLEMWDDCDFESIDLAIFTNTPTLSDLVEAEKDYNFELSVYRELLSLEDKKVLVYDGMYQKII